MSYTQAQIDRANAGRTYTIHKSCGAAAASLVHDGNGRPNALPYPF